MKEVLRSCYKCCENSDNTAKIFSYYSMLLFYFYFLLSSIIHIYFEIPVVSRVKLA